MDNFYLYLIIPNSTNTKLYSVRSNRRSIWMSQYDLIDLKIGGLLWATTAATTTMNWWIQRPNWIWNGMGIKRSERRLNEYWNANPYITFGATCVLCMTSCVVVACIRLSTRAHIHNEIRLCTLAVCPCVRALVWRRGVVIRISMALTLSRPTQK